ncbi:MAG TPA: IS630 family transposase [Pyrinomonadaceae bacterium]|nr:IS630 family transposase [Pyrinomonadaceae bacterium]
MRACLKSRQVATEREAGEAALKVLSQLAETRQIDLYFGDEAGFSMQPVLPRAWQPKGEQIRLFPQRDKKLNLFGIFRADNVAVTYQTKANINSGFLISSIDDFCRYVEKPTVLVLDNAPVHRSKLFQEQLLRWQVKDLYIFFLPRYCPHLNKAETFWRKAKYEWLKPTDYASFAKYERKIKEIFNGIGIQYKVNFKELKDKIYFV